jgi:hypothetical protein
MDSFLPTLPAPGEDEYKLPPVDPDHAIKLANHLAGLYVSNSITDISVKCGDETFNLHAPVLSNGSGYFRRVLSDEQSEIALEFNPNIEVSTFRIIVDSLYTGVVESITKENVTAILEASHHMEVTHVTEACTDFMLENLDLENCLNFWLSATLCGNEEVRLEAIGLIGRHLQQVSSSPKYLGLQSHTVESILSDDKLQVSSEVRVYEAAMAWLKLDTETRESQLNTILKAVRLPLLPVNYLVNVVGKEDMIEENSDAMRVYSKALKSQLGDGDKSVKSRHNVIYGVRGGFERMSKNIDHCPKPAVGSIFGRTCIPKNDDNEANGSRNLQLDAFKSNISSSLRNVSEKASQLDLGTHIQRGLSGLGSSMKKLGETLKNPETYNNLNKREVGGFWMKVNADVAENSDEEGGDKPLESETRLSIGETVEAEVEVEEKPLESEAIVNDDDTGASYQEEQFLADCNDDDVKNDAFDISKDDDEVENSFSLNDPLEDVPEGNEDNLSEENSFDMDNLSLDPNAATNDDGGELFGA